MQGVFLQREETVVKDELSHQTAHDFYIVFLGKLDLCLGSMSDLFLICYYLNLQ